MHLCTGTALESVAVLWRLRSYYDIIIIIMRPSSLGGDRILRRTLSVCLSVRPVIVAIGNVFSSTASVTDVLFGTH